MKANDPVLIQFNYHKEQSKDAPEPAESSQSSEMNLLGISTLMTKQFEDPQQMPSEHAQSTYLS